MAQALPASPPVAAGRRLAPSEVYWSRYEFVDFGCSKGGSLKFAKKRFAAENGLGVDVDSRKIEQALARGFDVVEGDLHALRGKRQVRFVSMMQFLEHLPELAEVERVVAKAAQLAKDFLYIHHPSFDDEHFLLSQGLRIYYHHWSGHTAHVRSDQFFEIFEHLPKESDAAREIERLDGMVRLQHWLTTNLLCDRRALSEKEIADVAAKDQDSPLLTMRQLKEAYRVSEKINVQAVRKRLRMSQQVFAHKYGFAVDAIQDWEQGRRKPNRSSHVLLQIIAREPEAVDRALRA